MIDLGDKNISIRFMDWLVQCVSSKLIEADDIKFQKISSDAGFRRYFRLNTNPTLIAVYAPPKKEKNLSFVKIAAFLKSSGILVPKILAVNFNEGFLIIQDFGDTTFQIAGTSSDYEALYRHADNLLLQFQQLSIVDVQLPVFNKKMILDEVHLFEEWFLRKTLEVPYSAEAQELLNNTYKKLIDNFLEQPQVFVHKDYHSRNLMIVPNGQIGVLDFQDALVGPISYDLVSLYRDCYVSLDPQYVDKKILAHKKCLEINGVIVDVAPATFKRWFDLTGLQRHLKVLGIFSRLAIRDRKMKYLGDIPLVIRYVREVTSAYKEFERFDTWFAETVESKLQTKKWFKGIQNNKAKGNIF